jgi:hypothetical protein
MVNLSFGYAKTSGSLAVRVSVPNMFIDQIFHGPCLHPPADVSPYVHGMVAHLVKTLLVPSDMRESVIDQGKAAYLKHGFTWSGEPDIGHDDHHE